MRFVLGLIVGVFVAIGIAYVHDNTISGTDRNTRAVVNWDAFNTEMRGVTDVVSTGWDKLTALVRKRE